MCPINYVLSLLKKRNYFENFFMYMGILTTNETYTFSKAGLETEWQQWGESLRHEAEDLNICLDFAFIGNLIMGKSLNL